MSYPATPLKTEWLAIAKNCSYTVTGEIKCMKLYECKFLINDRPHFQIKDKARKVARSISQQAQTVSSAPVPLQAKTLPQRPGRSRHLSKQLRSKGPRSQTHQTEDNRDSQEVGHLWQLNGYAAIACLHPFPADRTEDTDIFLSETTELLRIEKTAR